MRTSTVLRLVGFWLSVVVLVLAYAFLVGETLTDPGGWAAVGYVLVWLVPLVALLALVERRPETAARWAWVAVLVLVGYALWGAVDREARVDFQDSVGPVNTVLLMVVSTALVVLGRHEAHTMTAGLALLAATLLPVVIGAGNETMMRSSGIVGLPFLVTGLLYVASAALAHSGHHHLGHHAAA